MTYQYRVGDHIRVSRVQGSSWQGWHGTIVDVINRPEDPSVQECAVSLDGERRWFMAQQLIRSISPQFIRFFRNEALDRWRLDPDKAVLLNGDWDQLIEFLCDYCDFTIPRAQSEVAEFCAEFDRKIGQTTKIGMPLDAVSKSARSSQTLGGLAQSHPAA